MRNPGNTQAEIPPATPFWTPHQVRGDMPGTPPIAGPPVPGNPGNTQAEIPPATPFWTPHQVRGDMPGLSNTGSFRAPTRNPGIMCIIFVHSSWAARRTNQEAPPLLSDRGGRRLHRRRGLRNSPPAQTILAPFPPPG